MNKSRRTKIQKIINLLTELKDDISIIKDEEQECFDNLSDGLQQSERGQNMEECAYSLEDAESQLDDVISALEDIFETY